MSSPAVTRPLDTGDTAAAIELYGILTLGTTPTDPATFHKVLDHPGTTVFGCFTQGRLVSMTTLHVLPNVTMNGRPYALMENVVTHDAFREMGYGRAVIETAVAAAWAANAYKIMLLTGQKRGARGFYESVGFSSEDKHAMVMRRD